MIFQENKKILLITHKFTDPAFNLACEEYFLKQREENFILLWRNEPSIIIGINQNAYAELDMDYVEQNGIKIIRRLTGGGAVYHDLGNLNFTFITEGIEGLADFKAFLEPVISYLESLGLKAEFSGRNDILIEGAKVSGNAQAKYRHRTMFHGTLLFSASLSKLSKGLKPHPLKLKAKGIGSVISRVGNIRDYLTLDMGIDEFTEGLKKHFIETSACRIYELTDIDIKETERLVKEKYGLWSWNIGQSPAYSMEASALLPGGLVTLNIDVQKGLVSKIKVSGDFFGSKDIALLEETIKGSPHNRNELLKLLEGSNINISDFIAGASQEDFVNIFFS